MRCFLSICLLLLSFYAQAEQAPAPLRVASMNLCADQFLLLLAQQKNIAMLSDLAADKQYSHLWHKVGGIPLTAGDAEQLLPLKPQLIIAGIYDDKNRINLLRTFGFKVEIIPLVENISQVDEILLHVAQLIGEPDKGDELVQNLQQRIQKALSKKPLLGDNEKAPVAIIYAANGFTHAKGTLHDDLLTLAGFRNGATEIGMRGHGNLSLEQLLQIQPQLLIMEDSSDNKNSNAQRFLQHPALRRGLPNTTRASIPASLWMCGGPSSIEVLERLVEYRLQLEKTYAN